MLVATLFILLSSTGQSIDIFWPCLIAYTILGIGIEGSQPDAFPFAIEGSRPNDDVFQTSESQRSKSWRGAFVSLGFFYHGLGIFATSLAFLLCTRFFRARLQSNTCDAECQFSLDISWRTICVIGLLPLVLGLISLGLQLVIKTDKTNIVEYKTDNSRSD